MKLEFREMLESAGEMAKAMDPSVFVSVHQTAVFFDVARQADKARAITVRNAVVSHLLATYPHRKLFHVRDRGYRFFYTRCGDLRCGVRPELTDAERRSVLLGPQKGVNC
jgi:hypothetical protein